MVPQNKTQGVTQNNFYITSRLPSSSCIDWQPLDKQINHRTCVYNMNKHVRRLEKTPATKFVPCAGVLNASTKTNAPTLKTT